MTALRDTVAALTTASRQDELAAEAGVLYTRLSEIMLELFDITDNRELESVTECDKLKVRLFVERKSG